MTGGEEEVAKVSKDEVRKTEKRMKSGKSIGLDNIPLEFWKGLGGLAVKFLTVLFTMDLGQ